MNSGGWSEEGLNPEIVFPLLENAAISRSCRNSLKDALCPGLSLLAHPNGNTVSLLHCPLTSLYGGESYLFPPPVVDALHGGSYVDDAAALCAVWCPQCSSSRRGDVTSKADTLSNDIAVIWGAHVGVWRVTVMNINESRWNEVSSAASVGLCTVMKISFMAPNIMSLPQGVSFYACPNVKTDAREYGLCIYGADGVHLYDGEAPSTVLTAPVRTTTQRICSAWSPNGTLTLVASGGEVRIYRRFISENEGVNDSQQPNEASIEHSTCLCAEAAMDSTGNNKGAIVVGGILTAVSCDDTDFVATTSGGIDLSSTQEGGGGATSLTSLGALLQRKCAEEDFEETEHEFVESCRSGIINITAPAGGVSNNNGLQILSNSLMSINSTVQKDESACIDRRARLVLISSGEKDAIKLRASVTSSVPLHAQLSTPDLLACSEDGTYVAVGSRFCSKIACYYKNQRMNASENKCVFEYIPPLDLPPGCRPLGLHFLPACYDSNVHTSVSNIDRSGVRVLVLVSMSKTSSTDPPKPYISLPKTADTALLVYKLTHKIAEPEVKSVANDIERSQKTTETVAAAQEVSGTEALLRALQGMEARLSSRLGGLETLVQGQAQRIAALEAREGGTLPQPPT